MAASFDDIQADFEFLDDWEERYRYLIELGRDLDPLPDEAHNAENKVQGCVSQVWLQTKIGEGEDPAIEFLGDSDAHIVRGLVAVVLSLYSGKHASEIIAVEPESVLRKLGLDEHLTPQRANGLRAMIQRIRREAQVALQPQQV